MRTHHANAWSTELSSEMGATATTANVLTTSGSPPSPCYLAIVEFDVDGKIVPETREYILFDGNFDGTTFRTTALANRYLEGSGAGSGIVHPVGSTVWSGPTGMAMEDIWDEIEAHAAASTGVHGVGGSTVESTSGSQSKVNTHNAVTSPHSATSTQTANRLVLRDGSGRARFATPSNSADAATKGWTESNFFPSSPVAAPDFTDNTVMDNVGLNPGPGSPVVSQTFPTPSSGRVAITVAAAFRGNSPNSIIRVGFELYQGSGTGGTLVVSFGVSTSVQTSDLNIKIQGRTVVLGGLTPGVNHFARMMQEATAGAGTIISRSLGMFPLP